MMALHGHMSSHGSSHKSRQSFISNKIRKLLKEGKKRDQAIAIAISMAKRRKKKKKK